MSGRVYCLILLSVCSLLIGQDRLALARKSAEQEVDNGTYSAARKAMLNARSIVESTYLDPAVSLSVRLRYAEVAYLAGDFEEAEGVSRRIQSEKLTLGPEESVRLQIVLTGCRISLGNLREAEAAGAD